MTTHTSAVKHYTLIDTDGRHLYSYHYGYDNNNQLNLQFLSFDKITPANSFHSIYQLTLDQVQSIMQRVKEIAPVDARLYVDHVEVMDLEQKNDMLNKISPAEYKTETITSVKPLTASGLKAAKREAQLKLQLNGLLQQINSLSLRDCEKLTAAMKK